MATAVCAGLTGACSRGPVRLWWTALAALGLDVVTGVVPVLDPRPFPLAAATFVEELGEALAALALLAVVVRWVAGQRER